MIREEHSESHLSLVIGPPYIFPIFLDSLPYFDQLFDRIYTLWWPCLQLDRASGTDCECSQGYDTSDNIMQDRFFDKRAALKRYNTS